MNVANLGFTTTPAYLAARLLNGSDLYLLAGIVDGVEKRGLTYFDVNRQVWDISGWDLPPVAHPRFPFGLPVESDSLP